MKKEQTKGHKPRRFDRSALSPNQAAKILGITGEAVKQWIYKGWLKATKFPNGYWKIRHEDLQAYLEAQQNIAPNVCAATGSEAMAVQISTIAQRLGHRTTLILNFGEAIAKFSSNPANLLVVDLATFLDGWRLIRKIRKTSDFGSPKILLLFTKPLEEREIREAVRRGISGCLAQPVMDATLYAEMRMLTG